MPVWLPPRCPLDFRDKTWVEYRMQWLADHLGLDRLLRAEVILPEPRFFPDPYEASARGAARIFGRVCGYMGIDPGRVELEVRPDASMDGALGLYYEDATRPRIAIATSLLLDPEHLVATLAHELAHDILIGGGLLGVEGDFELLTDLLPSFLGLGLFSANATIRDRVADEGIARHSKVEGFGYLTARVFGYAMALFAFVRDERRPAWSRRLRPDAAASFKAGHRYLLKTGDSLFHPATAAQAARPLEMPEAIARLREGTPATRIATLWQLKDLPQAPPGLVAELDRCLGHNKIEIRREAAARLAEVGAAARGAVPSLIRCLASDDVELRMQAAVTLGEVGGDPDEVVPALAVLLRDPELNVAWYAAVSLARLGPPASSSAPALLRTMVAKRAHCMWHIVEACADALITFELDDERCKLLLDEVDPEHRPSAARELREARKRRLRAENADAVDPAPA